MAASNSVVIGRVGEITGVVYIKLPSGELVQLKEGMVVHANDVIVTADGGSILVYLADGSVFTLGQNSVARLDDDIMPRAAAEDLQAKNQDDVKDLAQKVLSGHAGDLDATAAGETGQPLSSSSQSPDAIQADRSQGNVTSGFDTGNSDGQGTGQPDNQTGNGDSQNSFFATQQAVFSVSLDIDRITSDSLVNAQEANGTINVTGTVTGLNLDHGTVTLTVNGKDYSGTYGSDGKYSIAVPGTDFVNDSDQIIQATTTGYNQQGDQATSSSTEFYLIDTSAGRVYVDPITGDNLVAGNEDQNVTISGKTTSIAAGQTVTVDVLDEAGATKYTGSATVGVDGKWSISGVDMSGWPDEANYHVVANAVDSSGNPAIKGEQDFSTRVTQSDSLTIQENTIGTGNVLSNDSNPNHTLQVTNFTIAGDTQTYSAGQTATISGIGQIVVQADGSYQFTPEHNWDGTVPKLTYNTNINEHDTLDISVEPVGSNHTGTVTIDPVTADNVINATESGSTVAVTGTAAGGDIKAGDTVTLVINGTQYTTTVGSDGKWSANVAGSDLAVDSDKTFTAVVSSKDSSGGTVISN
ncbi:retention module-containing protein, partial [Hydrogenovibrio marinus]